MTYRHDNGLVGVRPLTTPQHERLQSVVVRFDKPSARISLDWFSQLCCHLHATASMPAEWPAFMAELSCQLSADVVVLKVRGPWSGAEDLYRHDEHSEARELAAEQMFADEADADEAWPSIDCQIRRTARMVGMDIYRNGCISGQLRAWRDEHRRCFGAPEVSLLQLLAPHLQSALETRARLAQAASALAHYASAMDRLAIGTLILDHQCRVLHANNVARSILSEHDGVWMAAGQMKFRDREDAKRIREIIDRVRDPEESNPLAAAATARIRRGSDRADLRLIFRQLSNEKTERDSQLAGAVAVFMSAHAEEGELGAVPVDIIQNLFNLTPKEAELAQKLANGLSLQEASLILRIRPNTARAHLRSIFAKTGIGRQAKLVHTILRSVAMLGG